MIEVERDDGRLVAAARRGDEDAFARLYAGHHPPVYRYALHMCGAAMADDIVQDTFLALLRETNGFDPARGPLIAYLFGIARHYLLKEHLCRSRSHASSRSARAPALSRRDVEALRRKVGARVPWTAGTPPNLTLDFLAGEPPFGPVVAGAPYSGEGVTTVMQTLADGTRIERTVRAKVYRDSEGRTRREQTILGLGALGESQSVTIVDPVARVTYVLNAATHEGRRSPIAARGGNRGGPPPPSAGGFDVGAPPPPPPPPPSDADRLGEAARGRGRGVANMPEPLGTKQIEGVTASGTKRSEVIPTGRIGNDRPIEITDERWESPELRVLLLSRHHDPRTGEVDYRLTNIIRAEPPRELFVPPSDYTIIDAPPPPPPAPRRP